MAKIVHIELFMVDLLPKVRREDAIQSFVSQETPIVRIRDADGVEGIGYSYTIGTGGWSVMALIQHSLAPLVLGRDGDEPEAIWRDMLRITHATSIGAITALAMAAIDTALWDLRCKRAGLPLHKFAGGAQTSIPTYTTEGGWLHLTSDELVAGALEAQAEGFQGCKIKIGRSPQEDVERLSAVRAAVGPKFEIFTDANQAFTSDDVIRRAHLLAPLNLGWIEEPLPADDVAGHIRLSQSTPIPVAVGESIYSMSHFREYLERGACSIIQVDVARIGGITPWLKVAHMTECFNISVAPHFLMELHVSLCAAVPNARWVEYIPQLDAITHSGIKIEQGRAIPSDVPGLGIDWDMDAIAQMTLMHEILA